jgi:hypothetical protein
MFRLPLPLLVAGVRADHHHGARRIVRHFSHIGLTLALTFTIPLDARWFAAR